MKYITREEAIRLGLKRFFIGQPCAKGHIADRLVSKNQCGECRRLHKREAYKRSGPPKRFLTEEHKRRMRDNARKRNTGITPAEFEKMLSLQGGKCACCGQDKGSRSLHVDHCHQTGVLGKLLCGRCNMALGFLEHPLRPLWETYLREHRPLYDEIA